MTRRRLEETAPRHGEGGDGQEGEEGPACPRHLVRVGDVTVISCYVGRANVRVGGGTA
jgi:hypothetical protein